MKILARIFLLVLCGLVQGCRSSTHQSDDSGEPRVEGDKGILPPGSRQLAAVGTMPAEKYDGSTIAVNGRIVCDDGVTVRVFSPFGGRVAQIAADVGQPVIENDKLALFAFP